MRLRTPLSLLMPALVGPALALDAGQRPSTAKDPSANFDRVVTKTVEIPDGPGGLVLGSKALTDLLPTIGADGSLSILPGARIGRMQDGKYLATPDTLRIGGKGSTGDISTMCTQALGSAPCRTLSARFGAEPSVEDFGVDMTGAADSLVPLTTALNSGKLLTAPCGTIRVTGRLVVSQRAQFRGAGACTLIKYDAPAGTPIVPLLDIREGAGNSVFSDMAFDHQNNVKGYGYPTIYAGNLIAGSMVLIQADRVIMERVTGYNGSDNCFTIAHLPDSNPAQSSHGRPVGVSMRTVRTFGCGLNAEKTGVGIDVASGAATTVDDLVDIGSSGAFILDIGSGAQGNFSNLTGIGSKWDAARFATHGLRSQTFYIGEAGSNFTNLVSLDAGDRCMWIDRFTDRNTYANVQCKAPKQEGILWKARASTMSNLFIESPGYGQQNGTRDGIIFDTTAGPIDAANLIGVTFGNELNAARYAYVRRGDGALKGYVLGSDTSRANALGENLPTTFGVVDGATLGSGWTTYVPAIQCSVGGAPATPGTLSGSYRRTGRSVDLQVSVPISGVGSCSGSLQVGLPVPPAGRAVFSGVETALTGAALSAVAYENGFHATVRKYDGSSAVSTGNVVSLSGTYETR